MKKLLLVALCVMLAVSMIACGSESDPVDAGNGGGDDSNGEAFLIALSQEGLDHPFMTTQRQQIMDAAAAAGNVTVIATDGENSPLKQVQGIDDMMIQNPDIIMIQAAQAEPLRPQLAKIEEAGIPYMFVGKPIHGTNAIALVSMDNYEIGKNVGEYIVEYLTERNGSPSGNIVIMEGIPGDETSEDRVNGCKEIISEYPEIVVVSQVAGNYRRPDALSAMQDILQANPVGSIDFVYAANGEMGLGVAQAVKDANRTGEFAIASVDGDVASLEAIRDGDMTVAWTYAPCGDFAFELAMQYLNGGSIDVMNVIPSVRIDINNVDTEPPAF